jgi:hypothetical protein
MSSPVKTRPLAARRNDDRHRVSTSGDLRYPQFGCPPRSTACQSFLPWTPSIHTQSNAQEVANEETSITNHDDSRNQLTFPGNILP